MKITKYKRERLKNTERKPRNEKERVKKWVKERELERMNEEEKFKLERRKLKYLKENIQLNFAQT